MRFLRKLIGVGCLLAGFAWGQTTGPNVVTTLLVNNVAYPVGLNSIISTCTAVTCQIQNIGQTSHIARFAFTVTGAPIGVFEAVMQGSTDGSSWFNIGPGTVVNPVNQNQNATVTGYGAYPFLRVNAIFNNTGTDPASITEVYVGTSAPVFNNVDQFSANNGLLTFSTASPVYGTTTLIVPSGTTFSAQAVIGQAGVLYGYSLSGTASFTALQIGCTANLVTPALVSVLVNIVNAGAMVDVGKAIGLRPYGICPPTQALAYLATGSGAGALNFQFRYE